jgi:hypothetical protein
MTDAYFRTGVAAKQLGISSYQLRQLLEAGLVRGEWTAGEEWRIPASELTRLKKDGIPAVPQGLPEEEHSEAEEEPDRPSKEQNPGERQGWYAPPSEELIHSAEEVSITENRLAKRKIEREAEDLGARQE